MLTIFDKARTWIAFFWRHDKEYNESSLHSNPSHRSFQDKCLVLMGTDNRQIQEKESEVPVFGASIQMLDILRTNQP